MRRPLSFQQTRLLTFFRNNPGANASQAAQALYTTLPYQRAWAKADRTIKQLTKLGLLKTGPIRESCRANSIGIYLTSYQNSDTSYLGSFGKVLARGRQS